MPLKHWFKGEMGSYLREILLDSAALGRGYLNAKAVRRLIEEHLSGRHDRPGLLWQLLVFELWHRNFLEQLPYRTKELTRGGSGTDQEYAAIAANSAQISARVRGS